MIKFYQSFPQLVPSDLLEYPIISYFQYRNQGHLDDIPLTDALIKKYSAYRNKPRTFFTTNNIILSELKCSSIDRRGVFHHRICHFPSFYTPLEPVSSESKFLPNSRVNIHQYIHKELLNKIQTKTAVLFIHGYAENTFKFHEYGYFPLFYRKFKADIYAIELPYHFNRQPDDSPFSGSYFLNGNPIRMIEAVRQSVQEIVLLCQFLQYEYESIIVFGVSLGGHLSALVSQFIENVLLVCALASPFLFSLDPKIVPLSRQNVIKLRFEKRLKWYKLLGICNLKYFPPTSTNKKTVIVGGKYDRIVPIKRVKDLATLLSKPLIIYNGGHLSMYFWLNSILNQISEMVL